LGVKVNQTELSMPAQLADSGSPGSVVALFVDCVVPNGMLGITVASAKLSLGGAMKMPAWSSRLPFWPKKPPAWMNTVVPAVTPKLIFDWLPLNWSLQASVVRLPSDEPV